MRLTDYTSCQAVVSDTTPVLPLQMFPQRSEFVELFLYDGGFLTMNKYEGVEVRTWPGSCFFNCCHGQCQCVKSKYLRPSLGVARVLLFGCRCWSWARRPSLGFGGRRIHPLSASDTSPVCTTSPLNLAFELGGGQAARSEWPL